MPSIKLTKIFSNEREKVSLLVEKDGDKKYIENKGVGAFQ